MSEQETTLLNEARSILAEGVGQPCGCAHCVLVAKALDKLRELAPLPSAPALMTEGGA